MKDMIPVQPWMTAPATQRLMDPLISKGHSVRFVGGSVRDTLAGIAHDRTEIDIATDAQPDAVCEILRESGIHVVPTGVEHGTVTAVVDGTPFEVTTLRKDVETDGRRAVVEFSTDWREDAERRDFTFNAMSAERDGTLYDYFGGRADLEAGVVRFVGDPENRIREDVLRILRFFRFQAHFGKGEPEPRGLAACVALSELLPELSAERVKTELFKLLAAAAPSDTINLMLDRDLLLYWLPESHNPDDLNALCRIEKSRGEVDPLRRLAALCRFDRVGAERIADRLRFSRDERRRLLSIVENQGVLHEAMTPEDLRALLYRLGPRIVLDQVLVAGARGMAGWQRWAGCVDHWDAPEFPLKGRDILKEGVPAGPQVGAFLHALEEWWIEEGFEPDRDACLARLKAMMTQEKRA